MRDLVVALVEVHDEEALHRTEVVLLLDEEGSLALLDVLDCLQDLNLWKGNGVLVTVTPSSFFCYLYVWWRGVILTYVDWLVVESGTHLFDDLEFAGVILLAYAERGWKKIVLGIGCEGGLNSGGVLQRC